MFFASDNWAGAHPKVSAALTRHAEGFATAYGSSALDQAIEERFCKIFEREVAVFFVGTGTAANSLAIASVAKPGGVAFCHREAHVFEDECGAPEFLSQGRIVPVDGENGRIDPALLEAEIGRFDSVHTGRPAAVSITQATEIGTVYGTDEIDRISAIAKSHDLPFHMDGARFANALVSLDVTPAEMTWKRGVDIVSFGATKNGCWCAEAIVFMDPQMARDMLFMRKRAAQLFSKSRFVAAQFEAYFEGDLWLDIARHSNALAARLMAGLNASSRARPGWRADANEVFAVIHKDDAERARQKGAVFYDWPLPRALAGQLAEDEILVRLVTSFATTEEDVDRFLELVA